MAWGELGAKGGGLSLRSSLHPFLARGVDLPGFVQVAPSNYLPSESWEAFCLLAHAADTWLGLLVADSCALTRMVLTSQREGLCSADRLPGLEKCLSLLF